MAGTLGKLLVTLGLDSSEFLSGLNQAASESQGLASKITGTLGNIALGATIAGVAALGGAFVTAVGNASEAQDVMAQTEAVIKSTGGAAGMSAKQMGDLASSLSSANGLSKFGDEAILTGENLLATFTNIGKDTFPMATTAMVEMATAMHTDVSGGAIQLGKALNDPVKGITALTRVGVTFTAAQKNVIKHLEETGNIAGAQKVILAELAKEFGGSAAAAAATFSGKIATLKDKFGELLEGVGTKLLPMLSTFVDTLNSPAVQTGIQAVADGIVNGIGSAVTWLSTVGIPSVVTGWGMLTSAFATIMPYIQPVIDGFTALGNYLLNVWQDGDVLNQYLTSLPALLQPIVVIIGDYVNVLGDYFDTIMSVGTALINGDFMGALTALEAGLQGVASDLLTYYADIGTTLASIGAYVIANAATWGQALANWITPYIPVVLAYLQTLIAAVGTWITAQATVLQGYFMVWATAGGDWVTPYITIVLSYLQGLITSVGTWIAAQPGILTAQFTTWAVATYNWIPGATVQFLAAWPAMLNSFLDWIATAAGPILAQLGTWAITFVAWIAPQIPAIIAALASIAAAIAVFIGETAVVLTVKLVEWAIAMVSWIAKNVIPQLPTALNAITAIILSWINAQVGPYNAQILAWVMAFTDWVSKGVTPLLNSALASLGQMISAWINAAAGTAGQEAIKIGKSLIDGITQGLSNGSSLNDAIQNIINNALGAGRSAAIAHSPSQLFALKLGVPITQGIIQGVLSESDNLTGAMGSLMGTAVKGAKNLVGSVGDTLLNGELKASATAAGKAAIAGLAAGMFSAVDSAKSAAKSVSSSLVGSFQSALGIHSPSTVFADQVGVPAVLGVVEGMNATMPKVLEWVRGNLGKKLAGYLTDAAGLVRGAFDISQSLHDLGKVDPYQPLADATNAYQAAQKSVIDTSTKLNDINQKIADTTAAQGITRGSDISGNKTLLDLYQQQADAIKAQADAQKTVSSAWDTQINAMYTSDVQQHDVAALAVETQRAYTQLEQQSQAMMGVDAKQALDFFNQRKSQIAELADLQKKRILETDPNEQAFLDTQIKLLQAAQGAENTASQATVNISVPGGNNALTSDKVLAIIDQAFKAAGIKTDVRTRTA